MAMSKTSDNQSFRVVGGRPIGGRLIPSGNKNEALPVVAAALLAADSVQVESMPDILDVRLMVDIAARLGVGVSFDPSGTLNLDATGLSSHEPHPEMSRSIRGSFLFSAPLLARLGRARLPRPGGDKIGRRRVDTHLLALRALGAEIVVEDEAYEMRLEGRFRGTDVFLDEASVMATENAVMAAVCAEGRTRIANAASEPHVQGLCRALVAMGGRIQGIGTNHLEIEGVDTLHGASHRLGPDHIEIGSFIGLSAVTGGELIVEGVRADDLRMIGMTFKRLGVHTELQEGSLLVPGGQELAIQADIHDAIPKVDDAPWPGFPADLISIAIVVASQSEGTVLIHEKLFESRLFFVDKLVSMGAKIVLCDPHRVVVVGPAELHGGEIASPDIRAGMALLIAALCATGESTIRNIRQIDRGYERVDERLRELGADIRRV
ncbi:MAG: UDP-N-acetylglucosamine 1-carboxyvinyltransferase [Planctomycetes bacterium]|nr:UDP-N-acetylglucosamine 1-carboxyvinyltransferase [Planctomycetota bacterium]